MVNQERIINTFIELVSVPCPSLDEAAEAALVREKFLALPFFLSIHFITEKHAPGESDKHRLLRTGA